MCAPGPGSAAARRRGGRPAGGWRWCAGWRRSGSSGRSSACRNRSCATWLCLVRDCYLLIAPLSSYFYYSVLFWAPFSSFRQMSSALVVLGAVRSISLLLPR